MEKISLNTQDILIKHHEWTLKLEPNAPQMFRLYYQEQLYYQGELIVNNNHECLDLTQVQWHYRYRENRLEQWCQYQHVYSLSLNINYFFQQEHLVIEYLARNGVPTRLSIHHEILPMALVCNEQVKGHYQRHGVPSDIARQFSITDWFREAFSATQWINLDKV